MAPNRKKKKPAANPARGFATTSLPSKAKSVEQTNGTPTEDDSAAATPDVPGGADSHGPGNINPSADQPSIKDMSPDQLEAHLESAELEALVEKHAARSIADASRQLAKLETERRQLRSQAYRLSTHPWLGDETVDQLLGLKASEPRYSADDASASLPMVDEEKMIIDLWTLERVLESLNLPRVSEAIAHVAILATLGKLVVSSDSLPGLQEAFEWYASNTGASELPSYETATTSKPTQSGDSTPFQTNSGE